MRSAALTTTLFSAAVLATTVTTAPAATAAPRLTVVPCGAVLTSSVRLAADVVCPAGGTITLAADGVDLNLNGHALVGPGRSGGPAVNVAAQDVVVRNGTVRDWGAGVQASPADAGPDDAATATATVRDLRIQGTGTAVLVGSGGSVQVSDSWLTDNGRGGDTSFGGHLRVEHSTAQRNEIGFASFAVPADGLVVRDSLIRQNTTAGVTCGQDGHYIVSGSTLQRNGVGLDVFECSGTVTGSAFVWNQRHVDGFLVDQDTIVLRCNSYTRDGGPVGFPVEPCS